MANQNIGEVPSNIPVEHRRFLTQLRNAVVQMQGQTQPPAGPTNFIVTPIAGGNVIQFTREVSADNTVLYSSPTASLNDAGLHANLGYSTSYTDNVGQGSVTKYYWLRSYRGPTQGAIVGPVKGTTLALGTSTTLPANPPESSLSVTNSQTGNTIQPAVSGPSGVNPV